ncbi:hypothetical protein [Streptomyces sp. NPDC127119]|uniref:hypothetical protein n=1 Tax=Streptomyces sp. NPDC127119 TaxID=3345370 RepID=UPI00363EFEDF
MAICDGTPGAHGAGNPGSPEGPALRTRRRTGGTPRAVALIDDYVRLDYAALDSASAAVAGNGRHSDGSAGAETSPGSKLYITDPPEDDDVPGSEHPLIARNVVRRARSGATATAVRR